jgi:hypothetical protein
VLLGPVALTALVALSACKKDDEPRRAPPPASSAKAATCAGGGGTLSDAASAPFFPKTAGGFCLDPNGGDKAMGDGAPLPLDQICDLFDGECEVYKTFNVRRVVEARYVDGAGTPATIDIHLSKFATNEGAYGMFTKRVVGDGDPADDSAPKPTQAGGAAALGVGNAYLWRGQYLAEVTYNDESAAEPAIKAAGEKLLPPLLREMGAKLPGETQPPASAASLPTDNRLPLGVRYITKDVLGVDGAGNGAFGYYRDGDKRYRLAALTRADADQAKDALSSFSKMKGSAPEKNIGDGGAVRVVIKETDGVPTEWIFARNGKHVLGIGDEARVLRPNMSADEIAKLSLTKEQKIERLKKSLSAL